MIFILTISIFFITSRLVNIFLSLGLRETAFLHGTGPFHLGSANLWESMQRSTTLWIIYHLSHAEGQSAGGPEGEPLQVARC